MSLVSRATTLNQRLSGLHSRFGDPRYLGVVVLDLNGVQTVIAPNPKVMPMDSGVGVNAKANKVSLMQALDLNTDDMIIYGISRNYPETLVSNARYLLNATEVTPGVWTGSRHDCEYVDRSELLTFTVVVRPYRAR